MSIDKPSLLIIHGLLVLDCLQDLARQIEIANAATVHLIGYGDHRHQPTDGITLWAQAEFVATQIERRDLNNTWILGHSIGGAVSMFLADQRPDLIEAVINVEGNFTLKDAFWSCRIAAMTRDQWTTEFDAMKSNPSAWLQRNEIVETPKNLAWATSMLQREQPALTIHNMARAVISATSPPSYMDILRRVFDRTPVHLVAGERSAANWDVPAWARSKAASYVEIPRTGHMMMLEDMNRFSEMIRAIINH